MWREGGDIIDGQVLRQKGGKNNPSCAKEARITWFSATNVQTRSMENVWEKQACSIVTVKSARNDF